MLNLVFDAEIGEADLSRGDDGALSTGDGLETAVLISLHTDQRVDEHDVPSGASRGGWWGAAFPQETSDREGSRLWALLVGKDDEEAPRRARERARECLAWMLDVGLASSIEIQSSRVRVGVVGLSIEIALADGGRRSFLFEIGA